ncbi:hypothetical protein D3C72_1496910 [compost metagenome]
MVFERGLSLPSTKEYFMRELLYTSADFKTLQANGKKAREILYGNCRSGRLKFDVDLQSYMPGSRKVGQRPCDV